jgi:dolichol-phosphate mannosyltransferase
MKTDYFFYLKLMKKVVVIIPTYNERENVERMISVLEEEIFPKIKNNQMEILVVDDKSPDGTADVVRQKMKKFKNITLSLGDKEGLGAAYKRGMKYAMEKLGVDAVIEFDADFQHDPKYIPELVEKFNEGYDYVIGSRFVKGGSYPQEWSAYRKILTKYGGLFSRIVLFFPKINKVTDVSTGLKLTKVKGVLDKVDFDKVVNGFFYKTQILYQIVNQGAKIIEIPLKFKLREKGESKISSKDVLRTFLGDVKLRLTDPKILHFIRFGTVGFTGYLVNAFFLYLFAKIGFREWAAWAASTELAIITNFSLNNLWTFRSQKISGGRKLFYKLLQFNLTSSGALLIQTTVGTLAVSIFGPQYRQVILPFIVLFLVMPYNYFMANVVIWKRWKLPFLKKR